MLVSSFHNQTSDKMAQWENNIPLKRAVVVLTRIPDSQISALRPPTPQQFYSEDDDSSSDSDMQWRPDDDSSDSDCPFSYNKQKTSTKIDTNQPVASTSSNNSREPSVSTPASAVSHCSQDTTNESPKPPEMEVNVGMVVLARKKVRRWQKGKVVDIVTKEDGRLKYKVCFEEKGRSLVSGHHIAFDTTPTLEQLYVGARVVVQSPDNKFHFEPAVLAELPGRKNHLRFLVFMDDHTPAFVSLPLLHLVCRPLDNVLDNLTNLMHRCFMKKYLRDWPYPHLNQYKPGQSINVELDGVQQACEVQVVDCSLMEIVFQHNQHKEWIHRGSFRLEHMARFLE